MAKPTYSKVKKALEAYCKQHGFNTTDLHIRTGRDGKNYSQYANPKAVAWVSVDGCEIYNVINFHHGAKAFDDFHNFIDSLGCWFEIGEAWNFNIYDSND